MALKKILLLASFLLLSIFSKADTAYFTHLGVQDGLSQINILSIYQDEMGALWFGTFEGLNRYNGQTFSVFHPSQDKSGLTQNEIMAIHGDRKGNIYIQALHDLVRYDLKTQQFHTLLSDKVFNIDYQNDTLWVVTANELLYATTSDLTIRPFTIFQKEIKGFAPLCVTEEYIYVGTQDGVTQISLSHPKEQKQWLPSVKVKCIYQDSKKNLWVGTGKNGVYRLSPDGTTRNFINLPKNANSLSNNDVRCMVEDNFGHLWIGTFYGLNKYDPVRDKWENHVQQNHVSYSLSHSSIFALHKDTQGGVWIGTYFGGINYFNPARNYSNFYEANPDDPHALSFPFVGRMQEDNEHNLWICTEGGGLNFFDRKTRRFDRYTYREGQTSAIGHNNLKCIWFQKQTGNLYIGTHTGGLTIFDTHKRTSRTLRNIPGKANSLPSDVVNDLQYDKGRLLFSTQAGISAMNLETETFEPLSPNPEIRRIVENYIYETFHLDRNNRIWLSNGNGGVARIDLSTGVMQRYYHDSNLANTIGRFKVLHILENCKGELFFSTAGSGLFKYDPATDSFVCFSKENNLLMSNYCYYAEESGSGELIVLHNQGISSLHTDKKELTYTYTIPQMSFCQGSGIYITEDGEFFLGGTNGLISLSDKESSVPSKDHQFYFDQLIINNKAVQPGDGSGILSQTMPYTQAIKLSHDQNSLAFEFASSNYIRNKYRYEYRLKGFETTWLPLYSSKIVYTNLDPGSYELVVREINDAQVVCGERSLHIRIRPPFYANTYAYGLYLFIVCFVVYAIIRFNNRQAKLEASLEFERKEKERIKELNQTKLRFFTNISHEFRTPLTLIIGQIESLLQLNKLPPVMYNRMLRIYKNANHMRTLISELLDFRKQEQGYLKLKVECRDLVSFAKEIYMSFYEYALKNHITYKFESPGQAVNSWFDPVQMQKVIINLLSNAFKYTRPGGSITVGIRIQSQQVDILIKDNGAGIPEEFIHKIFERFYQIDGQTSGLSLGTGIGLALTKSIVELHQGTIRVESRLDEGSCFTVSLKSGNSHFTPNELQVGNLATCVTDNDLIPLEEPTLNEGAEEEGALADRPAILIVEDNDDLLEMLKEIFCPIYEVHTAKNGKEGFEQVRNIQPDIVLSDVMMPKMSGKEMCYKIKNSVDLSHIPVVLLTALTSVEYTIEGYMYGADDYITKPFNVKLLISRCNNLVKSRRALIKKFRNQQENLIVGNVINQTDQELIDKATLIIKKNFESLEFNMNVLANELGLGRNKLYARMKELTGLTPNEFTLKLKLDESMRLLNNHLELNISEISDRLGFSSTQYFSKCFKSVFGISPMTYRKSDSPASSLTPSKQE